MPIERKKHKSAEEKRLQLSPTSAFSGAVAGISQGIGLSLRNRTIGTETDNEAEMSYTKEEVDQLIQNAVQRAVEDTLRTADQRIATAVARAQEEIAAEYELKGAGVGFSAAQAKLLAEAMKELRVTSISSEIKIPVFNSKKTTAEAYMTEVERYFTALGHQPPQYLYLVKSILSNESKPWAEHVLRIVKTWDEFKVEFIKRFDSWIDANERIKALQSREQKIYEATEFFIYEMVRLAKLVSPNETEEESVQRAKLALYPRLRTALGPTTFQTPDALFQAVRLVHGNLEAEDRLNNVKSKIPPLMKENHDNKNRQEEEGKNKNPESGSNSNSKDGNSYGNSCSTSRGGSRWRGRGNYYSRGNYNNNGQQNSKPESTSTGNGRNMQSGPSASSEAAISGNSQSKGNWTENANKIKCYKCSGMGHVAKSCPSQTGVALNTTISEANETWLSQSTEPEQNPKN